MIPPPRLGLTLSLSLCVCVAVRHSGLGEEGAKKVAIKSRNGRYVGIDTHGRVRTHPECAKAEMFEEVSVL